MIDSGLVGEVSRGEKMLYSGTEPQSYITEYTLVYAAKVLAGGGEQRSTARAGVYLLKVDVTV